MCTIVIDYIVNLIVIDNYVRD